MYHRMLIDTKFYNSLLELDRIIALQVRQDQCIFCHGNLHQSHFLRKPRGIPTNTHSDYPIRFSFCCGRDGCRKRITPPSLRFLSRKVYSSVLIILIFLFESGTDEGRIEELNRLLGTTLSVETLRRWRRFWVQDVSESNTWKRSGFSHSLAQMLPVSLLNQFHDTLDKQLKKLLRWLLPLTTGITLFDVPFSVIAF